MSEVLKTLTGTHPGLIATISQDPFPDSPASWGTPYHIAYLSKSRNCLGTEATSVERMDEIGAKVLSQEYIGIPVWAYVHSSATIKAAWDNPFGCPWDSGRSGWVYCSWSEALKDARRERMSPQFLRKVHEALRGFVKDYNTFLQGDVYVIEIKETKTGEVLDSCGGFYGWDNAVKEAENMLEAVAKVQPKQARLNWKEVRDER